MWAKAAAVASCPPAGCPPPCCVSPGMSVFPSLVLWPSCSGMSPPDTPSCTPKIHHEPLLGNTCMPGATGTPLRAERTFLYSSPQLSAHAQPVDSPAVLKFLHDNKTKDEKKKIKNNPFFSFLALSCCSISPVTPKPLVLWVGG